MVDQGETSDVIIHMISAAGCHVLLGLGWVGVGIDCSHSTQTAVCEHAERIRCV
jgi:hypothetical protein